MKLIPSLLTSLLLYSSSSLASAINNRPDPNPDPNSSSNPDSISIFNNLGNDEVLLEYTYLRNYPFYYERHALRIVKLLDEPVDANGPAEQVRAIVPLYDSDDTYLREFSIRHARSDLLCRFLEAGGQTEKHPYGRVLNRDFGDATEVRPGQPVVFRKLQRANRLVCAAPEWEWAGEGWDIRFV